MLNNVIQGTSKRPYNLQAQDDGHKEGGEDDQDVDTAGDPGAGEDGELRAAGHLLGLQPPPGLQLVLYTPVTAGQPLHTAGVCSTARGATLRRQAAVNPHLKPAENINCNFSISKFVLLVPRGLGNITVARVGYCWCPPSLP